VENLVEDGLYGLFVHAALPVEIGIPRFGIEFDGSKPGAILSAVVLLLHQQVHFAQPVVQVAIFFFVKRQGFEQPY
jgi:hypothetical protein